MPAATSLLRGPGSDDEITSMSQRLGGRPVGEAFWGGRSGGGLGRPACTDRCSVAVLPACGGCVAYVMSPAIYCALCHPRFPPACVPTCPRALPMCAAKKTGKAVALSVNLPAGEPLMRAWAEKRLLQELQALQLVRRSCYFLMANVNCFTAGEGHNCSRWCLSRIGQLPLHLALNASPAACIHFDAPSAAFC